MACSKVQDFLHSFSTAIQGGFQELGAGSRMIYTNGTRVERLWFCGRSGKATFVHGTQDGL